MMTRMVGLPAIPWQLVLPRWGACVGLLIILLTLGELALAAGDVPPSIGLRALPQSNVVALTWVQPAGAAWDGGLRPGDHVVAVDGRTVADFGAAAIAAAAPGAHWIQGCDATGRCVTVTTDTASIKSARRQVAFILLAAWFALIGGVTFILARDVITALALLIATGGAAMALLAALATPYGASWSLATVFVALQCFGLGLLLFFLRFPLDRSDTFGGRVALALGLAAHATLVAAYPVVFWIKPAAYALLGPAGQLVLVADLVCCCILSIAAWLGSPAERPARRSALASVALGLTAGVLPFALLAFLPPALGVPSLLAPDVAVLTMGFLPAGLAIALLSRQFLGITRFLRRGLIAAVVWLGLLSVFAVGFDALRHHGWAAHSSLTMLLDSTLVTGALFAGLFPPLQATLRRAIERRCFPDHYDPATILHQFATSLVGLPGGDPEALAQQILARLGVTLDLIWCALVLREGDLATHTWTYGRVPTHAIPGDWLDRQQPAFVTLCHAESEHGYVVPLVIDGLRCGELVLGPKRADVELLPRDAELLGTLAPLLAIALQNALRARQLARQLGTLAERETMLAALSGRVLRAQEEERQRIALEIHDDPLQRVTLLARRLDDGPARDALEDIVGALRAICEGLRPPILDDLGLAAALDWLADDAQAQADRDLTIEVRVMTGVADVVRDIELEVALFRIAQEALHNVLKHADADSVAITLTRGDGTLLLRIADDGRGLPGSGGPAGLGMTASHLGLAGMRERLRPWNGSVTFEAGITGGLAVTAMVAVEGRDA